MGAEIRALLPYFINFALVVLALYFMLRKPLRKFIYQRHERMRDALESAAIAHKKAVERAQIARKAMAAIAEEEKSLLQNEAGAAEDEKREILAKAQAEALRVAREADRLAHVEQDDASERVKSQFLDLVVRETENRLRDGLKRDDHNAILKRAKNSIEVGV